MLPKVFHLQFELVNGSAGGARMETCSCRACRRQTRQETYRGPPPRLSRGRRARLRSARYNYFHYEAKIDPPRLVSFALAVSHDIVNRLARPSGRGYGDVIRVLNVVDSAVDKSERERLERLGVLRLTDRFCRGHWFDLFQIRNGVPSHKPIVACRGSVNNRPRSTRPSVSAASALVGAEAAIEPSFAESLGSRHLRRAG